MLEIQTPATKTAVEFDRDMSASSEGNEAGNGVKLIMDECCGHRRLSVKLFKGQITQKLEKNLLFT